MTAHILIDVKTGHLSAIDDKGDPVAESKRPFETRGEWLIALAGLCYTTGIERLEFLTGGQVEIRNAREWFSAMLTAEEQEEENEDESPARCHYCRTGVGASCDCV